MFARLFSAPTNPDKAVPPELAFATEESPAADEEAEPPRVDAPEDCPPIVLPRLAPPPIPEDVEEDAVEADAANSWVFDESDDDDDDDDDGVAAGGALHTSCFSVTPNVERRAGMRTHEDTCMAREGGSSGRPSASSNAALALVFAAAAAAAALDEDPAAPPPPLVWKDKLPDEPVKDAEDVIETFGEDVSCGAVSGTGIYDALVEGGNEETTGAYKGETVKVVISLAALTGFQGSKAAKASGIPNDGGFEALHSTRGGGNCGNGVIALIDMSFWTVFFVRGAGFNGRTSGAATDVPVVPARPPRAFFPDAFAKFAVPGALGADGPLPVGRFFMTRAALDGVVVVVVVIWTGYAGETI